VASGKHEHPIPTYSDRSEEGNHVSAPAGWLSSHVRLADTVHMATGLDLEGDDGCDTGAGGIEDLSTVL
jgi:hypothetical protein